MPLKLGKKARGDTFRLLLMIDSTVYVLTHLQPDERVAAPAWRLTKTKKGVPVGVAHDVSRDAHGWHCTCEDWIYRASKVGEHCKHIKACCAVGLVKIFQGAPEF